MDAIVLHCKKLFSMLYWSMFYKKILSFYFKMCLFVINLWNLLAMSVESKSWISLFLTSCDGRVSLSTQWQDEGQRSCFSYKGQKVKLHSESMMGITKSEEHDSRLTLKLKLNLICNPLGQSDISIIRMEDGCVVLFYGVSDIICNQPLPKHFRCERVPQVSDHIWSESIFSVSWWKWLPEEI